MKVYTLAILFGLFMVYTDSSKCTLKDALYEPKEVHTTPLIFTEKAATNG